MALHNAESLCVLLENNRPCHTVDKAFFLLTLKATQKPWMEGNARLIKDYNSGDGQFMLHSHQQNWVTPR